ncbi:MAG TPA: helix-hairpin-helix domain-containing protein [Bacillota bacterium]|nr:helix-hairpin-helix domain-containing protein [Bacillota bacterium]
MFGLTVRQRIAALILLVFLAIGGMLMFVVGNKGITQKYEDDATINSIYVDIRGAVAKPGLLCLKPGTRKFEALKKAGGALPEADLEQINLAEFVEDGERIYLPKKGEVIDTPVKRHWKTTSKTAKSKVIRNENNKGIPVSQKIQTQWPIDVNSVNQAQLENVPGIGPFLAAKIIEYRNKNGNFKNLEDLQGVYGIGPKKLEKLRPYLYVK